MSAAFSKGKGKVQQIYVPTRTGLVQRSAGTTIPRVARDMKKKLRELRDEREWEVLDAIHDCRLTVAEVYDACVAKQIPELKARLRAIDLRDHLDDWQKWVVANTGVEDTAEKYRQQVETLIPAADAEDGGSSAPFLSSSLTRERLTTWLAGLEVSTGTRRKYLYAMRSFIRYLMDVGVLTEDPSARVARPKKGKARVRWEPLDNILRIADAQPAPYRAISYLLHATGAEISAALAMYRRDLDLEQGLAHIPGTKTGTRDRHDALVEAWAIPVLQEHCRSLVPNALLFPDVTRHMASKKHAAACAAVGVEDYTQHDARHSWAVRARKRGVSLEAIAEQLGHASLASTLIYARFKPTLEERQAEGAR